MNGAWLNAETELLGAGDFEMTLGDEETVVVVREAGLDDYDRIVRVWSEAGLPFRPQGRDSRESIGLELGRGCSVFLLAEAGSRAVGVVLGTHDGRKGWVNRLAVVPDHRRSGLGRRLVRDVEVWLETQGIEICASLIESANEESVAFFAHMDYVHDAEIEYFSKRRSPET